MAAIHWDRYLRASVASGELKQAQLKQLGITQSPGELADQAELNVAMIRALEQAIAWDPRFARAHLRLAAKCIVQFELLQREADNAMTLAQLREAAASAAFTSQADTQAWLARAFGENLKWLHRAAAEARIAAALSPLQGEAYIYLEQLAILRDTGVASSQALIEQGLRVRPHDAEVLFEVGREELLAGNLDGAISHWQRCFQDPGPHQQKIIHLLAGRVPAPVFLATFQPEWQTLRDVWQRYRQLGQPADVDALLTYAADKTAAAVRTENARTRAFVWYWQSQLYGDVGRPADELDCLQRAYQSDARHYFIRLALARALHKSGRYAEAEPHYRWCLARRPADKNLTRALLQLSKQRLAQRERGVSPKPTVVTRPATIAAAADSSAHK
jgi:tetratricopeptide (TPR) repeat protein